MNKKMQPPLDEEEFMVYELDYTGERIKLYIKPEELQTYSNPERVLIIIIKKIFHRIYIWNGSDSQVRKQMISSRVAKDIQRDLKDRDYKIISIDQGSEPSKYQNQKFFKFIERLYLIHQRTCDRCGQKGSREEIQTVFYSYKSHPRDIFGPRILHQSYNLCSRCKTFWEFDPHHLVYRRRHW